MVNVTITGADRVMAALSGLGIRGPQAVAAGLYQEGQAILKDSQEHYVPVDSGTLRGSGYVSQPVMSGGGAMVEIGYGGAARDYALSVHENPRAGKTGGLSPSGKRYKHWAAIGEFKFLETPFKLAAAGLGDRLAVYLEAAHGAA